ncbi:hypothetical protein FJT64_006973 [Amphibalanus amphitrite]|uniref:Uncharacterized protein n=1 Tax=Amphibalanus amphitrite TaxID=1232801 RepID=A0A6A4VVK0_AMPAM|nr:hypothetical protein FJT64_006973 [Amphibalanus amphitrite]
MRASIASMRSSCMRLLDGVNIFPDMEKIRSDGPELAVMLKWCSKKRLGSQPGSQKGCQDPGPYCKNETKRVIPRPLSAHCSLGS